MVIAQAVNVEFFVFMGDFRREVEFFNRLRYHFLGYFGAGLEMRDVGVGQLGSLRQARMPSIGSIMTGPYHTHNLNFPLLALIEQIVSIFLD